MKQERFARAQRRAERLVVSITVCWDDSVLEIRQIRAPGGFWLSDGSRGREQSDFVMPGIELEGGRVPLVLVEGLDMVSVVVPRGAGCSLQAEGGEPVELGHPEPGPEPEPPRAGVGLTLLALEQPAGAYCLRLPRGTVVTVRLARLSFRVSASQAEARVRSVSAGPALRAAAWAGGLSLLLHAGLGLSSCAAPAPMEGPDGLSPEQRHLIQYYLDGADERAMQEQESEQLEQETADNREAGTGARAKGEEGSMGNPATRSAPAARYGVGGPGDAADPHIARQVALRDAAEFGLVGLLNSGAGGNPDAPPAPWGRDDSLGNDPMSARGNMWGSASGGGGLGLSGIGQIGGGRGPGGPALSGNRYAPGGIGAGSYGRPGRNVAPTPDGSQDDDEDARGSEESDTSSARGPRAGMPLDPNGRFSTSYRPGHGHLAAFEAAVARGVVPVAARELVSDVGARYTPTLPEPKGKALGYAVDLERSALPPSGGPVHVRISLRASAERPHERPRLAIHLALDVSGSMQGEPLARAKEAAQHLVERLAPTDEFSLITFSSEAQVAVQSGLVGPRRSAIEEAIASANNGGGTNIGEALALAYQQARLHEAGNEAVPVVMLLSDGQPTVGERDAKVLSAAALDAFQGGIQTSTFGLGSGYDGVLMSSLASDGAGGYYYLRDAEQIASAFRSELDQRLDPTANAVEIRVRLDRDVALLRVYGSSRLGGVEAAHERAKEVAVDVQAAKRQGIARDRQEDVKGGMRFFIPAFARDDSYSLLLQVAVPPGSADRALGIVELKYKDLITRRNAAEESTIRVSFAADDAASARTTDASVMRTVQGHLAGEDLMAASKLIAMGQSSQAVQLLGEREAILRTAASALQEPGFVTDATRFSRLLSHMDGGDLGAQPYALAMVLETAARSHLQ